MILDGTVGDTLELGGILLVNKPKGPTSHDVVAAVRRRIHGIKVGHTGTLDPAAEGLLVLCLGRMTRVARLFSDLPKEYCGTVLLGRETDSLDLQGRTVARAHVPQGLLGAAARWVKSVRGAIDQEAPLFSARKWKGKALHRWTRLGKDVPVSVKRVELIEADVERGASHRRIEFRIVVSSGFYVRSWARDLGHALGIPACLARLERTAVGPFRVEDAVDLDPLDRDSVECSILTGERALPWVETSNVGADGLLLLRKGIPVRTNDSESNEQEKIVKLLDAEERLTLLAKRSGGLIRPWIVLRPWTGEEQ